MKQNLKQLSFIFLTSSLLVFSSCNKEQTEQSDNNLLLGKWEKQSECHTDIVTNDSVRYTYTDSTESYYYADSTLIFCHYDTTTTYYEPNQLLYIFNNDGTFLIIRFVSEEWGYDTLRFNWEQRGKLLKINNSIYEIDTLDYNSLVISTRVEREHLYTHTGTYVIWNGNEWLFGRWERCTTLTFKRKN